MVLTPRRWRQVLRRLVRLNRVGQDRQSAGRRWQKSRSPGRSRYKPLKPLRAGMPGDFGATAVNTRVHSPIPMRTRGCGCIVLPAFPTPSVFRAISFRQQPGRIASRDQSACLGARHEPQSESSRRTPGPIATGRCCHDGTPAPSSKCSFTEYGSRRAPGRRGVCGPFTHTPIPLAPLILPTRCRY